jgi:hypothetical protein
LLKSNKTVDVGSDGDVVGGNVVDGNVDVVATLVSTAVVVAIG